MPEYLIALVANTAITVPGMASGLHHDPPTDQRARKLQTMQRRGQPTARVFFSNIGLPGDPPNKNAVE